MVSVSCPPLKGKSKCANRTRVTPAVYMLLADGALYTCLGEIRSCRKYGSGYWAMGNGCLAPVASVSSSVRAESLGESSQVLRGSPQIAKL